MPDPVRLVTPWAAQSIQRTMITDAVGVYLTDSSGRQYYDLCAQLMAANLGHRHPDVMAAIQTAQFGHISPSLMTPDREALQAMFSTIAPPGLTELFLTTGGADAVENAIKLARLSTGRHKIIAKYRSYHGATAAAITLSGDPRRWSQSAVETPGIVRIEDPYCLRCPWGQHPDSCGYACVSHIQRVIEMEGPHTIAAIILEGESGTSGCIKYPPLYWQQVKALVDKYGILLIADEVMSGFGRCGDWFAVSGHGVVPDIIVMAKGLTAGYVPMGGILFKPELLHDFQTQVLPMGLTYSAHPLGCRVACASIKAYQTHGVFNNVLAISKRLTTVLHNRFEAHPGVKDTRLSGLLGVIELSYEGPRDGFEWTEWLSQRLLAVGIYPIVRWHYIFIAPPLITDWASLEAALDCVYSVIDEWWAKI